MEKTTIDCRTGREQQEPLSAGEAAQLEADREAFAQQLAAREAAAKVRAEAIARLKTSSNPEIAELTKLLFL